LRTGKAMDLKFEGLESINSVVYEPNGYTAAITGSNGIAIIFDVKTGQERYRYEHKPIATTAAFSTDGSILALGGIDGSITLHDLVLHRYVRNIKEDLYGISSMAISADFPFTLFAASGKTVTMYDMCRNYTIFRFHHAAGVNAINLSNNGKYMAAGCQNGEIYVWDLPTASAISKFSADLKSVTAVHFSSEGELLYSGGSDGLIKVWDWRSQNLNAVGRGHHDEITSLDLSKCGTRLYSGGNDHTVHCWDLTERAESDDASEAADLELLVIMHHLKEGYLWTTPPVADIASSGWFWTDRRELINVAKHDESREKVASLSEAELTEYYKIYCRKDMVMDRLTSPDRYKEKESRLNKIITKQKNMNLLEGETMIQRRLKAPQD
jgi:WD40 repeat protein